MRNLCAYVRELVKWADARCNLHRVRPNSRRSNYWARAMVKHLRQCDRLAYRLTPAEWNYFREECQAAKARDAKFTAALYHTEL